MRFHHIGVACATLEEGRKDHEILGYQCEGEEFVDPLQKVRFLFMKLGDMRIELLEPLDDSSPVASFLKRQIRIYHQCFECDHLEEAIAHLRNHGAYVASPPKAAIAFQGRRVAFLMTSGGALVELLESKREHDGSESGKSAS